MSVFASVPRFKGYSTYETLKNKINTMKGTSEYNTYSKERRDFYE